MTSLSSTRCLRSPWLRTCSSWGRLGCVSRRRCPTFHPWTSWRRSARNGSDAAKKICLNLSQWPNKTTIATRSKCSSSSVTWTVCARVSPSKPLPGWWPLSKTRQVQPTSPQWNSLSPRPLFVKDPRNHYLLTSSTARNRETFWKGRILT